MNVMLTRSHQRQISTCWEPFATSTPLKVVQNNVNREKQFSKEFLIHSNSFDLIKKLQKGCSSTEVSAKKLTELKQLVIKRPRKSKSCANFDFSSSDEDSSNENKKRPIIKLGSQNQTNLLNTNESKKNNVSDVILKLNNDHILKSKEKQNSIKSKVADKFDSDEENHIFDKTNYSNNITCNVKLCLHSRENGNKGYKKHENSKSLQNSFKSEKNKSKKIPKNKQKTLKHVKNDSQTLLNSSKTNSKNKEPQKINKRKCKNTVSAVKCPKLTRSRKLNNVSKTFTKQSNNTNIAEIPSYITEKKINSSHQLFSDSREQELINILDLTSEDVTEKTEIDTCLSQPKEKDLLYCSPYPSNYRNCVKKSKKNILKKYSNYNKSQLLRNHSNEHSEENQLKHETDFVNSKKNNEFVEETELKKKSEERDNCLKDLTRKNSNENDVNFKQAEKKAKKKSVSKVKQKKETLTSNDATKNINNTEIKNKETSKGKVSVGTVENFTNNCELSKPSQQVEDEKTIEPEKPVFKLLNELTYSEDKTGCAAVECWDVNNFKCGIFKLKVKSQMTCKTLHKNSHLGGSLIKGKLRMKIGNKELDLNQGDMAFVPPLTEWQATNIGECESVFYYWCGRFKT